ncbi:unnamed protein product [Clavelina lepadiformis]|uniref:PDZ domain-containing protein n=1 Tax=Clavelina lepadiformis TaxID=159417 RepID=A0ABP0G580_CLALP
MPNRVISWPEGFGFHIYGDGPSYVVSVEKDSDAGRSGLQAGDQILQLNEHNVGDLSSERIKELVSGLAFPPLPSLGVVSKLRKVALVGRSSVYNLYGLTLSGTLPVIISHVEPFSSASQANLKENDVLIKVDDKYVTSHTQARNILRKSCRCGGANICIISTYKAPDAPLQLMSSITEDISEVTLSTGHTKAYDFVSKVSSPLNG